MHLRPTLMEEAIRKSVGYADKPRRYETSGVGHVHGIYRRFFDLSTMCPKAAPYGTWHSPITSDSIVQNVSNQLINTQKALQYYLILLPSTLQAVKISSIFVDPVASSIYHIEARPSEAGRCVIVDTSKGKDIFGPGWSARSCVEESGGGAAIAYGGIVYFSNFGDLKVYKVDVGKEDGPVAVIPGIFHFLGLAFCF